MRNPDIAIIIPDWNPLDPEPGIKWWIAEKNIESDITWQITAGQKLNSPEVRIRLYAELDKPYSVNDRKAYAAILGSDTCVYTATQPNYIAPPRIEENKPDPIPTRHGFIKGKNRTLVLPVVTEEQKKKYAPVLRRYKKGESYPINQAQKLLNEGQMFRRVLIPVTMSLANRYPNDPGYIFYKTLIMMDQIPADKRRPGHGSEEVLQNVREMIEDGIWKVNYDNSERAKRASNNKNQDYNNEIRILPKYSMGELYSALNKVDRTADDFSDVIQNIAAILNSLDDYYPLYLMFMEWIREDTPYKKFEDNKIRELWNECIANADPEIVKQGAEYIYNLARDSQWEGINDDISKGVQKYLKSELLQKRKILTNIYGVAQVDGGASVIISRAYNDGLGCWATQFQTLPDLNLFYKQDGIWITKPDKNNNLTVEKNSIVEIWSNSKNRKQYTSVVFDPMPGVIASGGTLPGGHKYNFYQGLAITPCAGEWNLIDWHIKNIICKGDEAKYNYFLNWSARMFQQPNKQGMVVLLLHSNAEGTGKNIIVDMFTKAFGQHGVMISDEKELTATFNSRMAQTVFVLFNESIWGGNKQTIGKVKSMITDKDIALELKHKDRITMKNCLHIIMASNNDVPTSITSGDRRYCGFDVSEEKVGDAEYFSKLAKQIDNGGCEAFIHHLLNRDISKFDVTDISGFESDIKTQTKLHTVAPEAVWWKEVLGDGYLTLNNPTANKESQISDNKISTSMLHKAFMKWIDENKRSVYNPMTKNALGTFIRGQLCVDACSQASNVGKSHLKGIHFLSLEKCRKAFESFLNESVDWDQ